MAQKPRKPYRILEGDCRQSLRRLKAGSVHCMITSPPYYGMRNYGVDGQLGVERTLRRYVQKLVRIFREVRRVLRDDGTVWLNLGDSYAGGPIGPPGSKLQAHNQGANDAIGLDKSQSGINEKNLMGVPWRVALALQQDGWYLRSDIIWDKINPMPESVRDRPTRCHEYIFLLTKRPRYYYDLAGLAEIAAASEAEPGAVRNKRDVWHVSPAKVARQKHFATYPEPLIEPCILAGTSERGCCPQCGTPWQRVATRPARTLPSLTADWEAGCRCGRKRPPVPCTVMDIFSGSATTGVVALKLQRQYVGLELNPKYVELGRQRCRHAQHHPQARLACLFQPGHKVAKSARVAGRHLFRRRH